MRGRLWLAVGLLALVAGCGGSETKSSEPTTAPAQAHFATSENCAELLKLGETFAEALQATSGSADTSVANAAEAFRTMADAAPSEIRDDFRTVAEAFGIYLQAWKDAGFEPGETPTPAQIAKLVQATQAFGTPEVEAAQNRVSAWTAKNCGGTTTTEGG